MTDQISGFVTSVESSRQGVIATSWVGDQMTVWNAADIDRSGCDLTPDDGATIHRCTGVVVDGDDSDVITMSGSAPSSWPAGGTDADGQDIPAEVRLDLWPEVLDVVAMVDPGDGEVLPVTVPHALRPLLAEGLRDPEHMEQVICSRQGTGWVVDDVIGLRAQVGMDGLSDAVQVAITSANGKTTITHSTTAPDADGVAVGDTWMRHDGAISSPVVGMWSWDGTSWVSSELSGAVLAAIDAGTITTGLLSGITFCSPSPTALPRVEISGSVVRIVRDAGDGTGVVTTVLGGSDGDQLAITGTDGAMVGGIDPDGVITGSSVQVADDISVAGTPLLWTINDRPAGPVAAQIFPTDSNPVGTTETALYDLLFTQEAGRIYRIVFDGAVSTSDTAYADLWFRATYGTPENPPAQPTTASPAIRHVVAHGPTAGGVPADAHMEFLVTPSITTQVWRVALSIKGTAAGTVKVTSGAFFIVEDMGRAYPGDFNDGNTGSSAVQTYTKTYPYSWLRIWRDGTVMSVNTPQQGYASRALGTGHPAGQWYTMVGFPSAMLADLNGAQKIASIEFWCNNVDTMNNRGFRPRIGFHGQSSAPGSISGEAIYDADLIPRGGHQWVTLRNDRYTNIGNSTYKGLTFGLNDGGNLDYSGSFYITTDKTTTGGAFRATFTK